MANTVNLDIASRVDITCRKGDTFSLELTFKDENGNPIDISSGYNWLMQVRDSDTSETTLISGDSTNVNDDGFAFTGNSDGVLVVTSASSVTSLVDGGLYVYDLQSVQGTNVVTWIYGIFKVNEDISE